jgi:hypothetical protein
MFALLEITNVLPEYKITVSVINAHRQHIGAIIQTHQRLSRASATALAKSASNRDSLTN